MVALRTRTPTKTATPTTTDPSYYRRRWAARGWRTDLNSHTHTRRRPREHTYKPAVAVCEGGGAKPPGPGERCEKLPARSPINKQRNLAGPKPPDQAPPARGPPRGSLVKVRDRATGIAGLVPVVVLGFDGRQKRQALAALRERDLPSTCPLDVVVLHALAVELVAGVNANRERRLDAPSHHVELPTPPARRPPRLKRWWCFRWRRSPSTHADVDGVAVPRDRDARGGPKPLAHSRRSQPQVPELALQRRDLDIQRCERSSSHQRRAGGTKPRVGGTKPRKRRAGGTKPREKRGGGGCSERCLEKETATVMDMSTATLVLVPSRANVAKFTGTHRHHRHRRRECRRDDEHAQLLRPTTAATTNCLRTPTYPYVHLRSPTYSSHHSPHFVLLPAEPAPGNRWRREAPTRRTSGRHEAPRQTSPTTPQPPPGPKPLSWDAEVGAGGDDLHNASGHLG